ncbi:MAG: Gldg family protein, partial [Planctomycetia bacterium]|nr:Gldg family protein [Planctomycetia bacterium]
MNGTCCSVFRRNFGSYFSGPLGWLFICVFVSLSVLSAFWPHDFFNNNLANLDSLNRLFPMVMLIFVPAITMGLWADERRQGTDELLLTLPATDFQVVLGKYFSALGIYTVSLLFSAICTYSVLRSLGNPDVGLFTVTYLGYWFTGWAMLAIGMVASFLTSSLPVAYILGAIFNAPLVFAANADAICGTGTFFGRSVNFADVIRRWSFSEQFRDFARGVFSVSGVVYFLLIVVVMLYLCMILIGRRHWNTGARGVGLSFHYTIRTLALIAILVSVNLVFANHDIRFDGSAEKLSSLSPATIRLLDEIRTGRMDEPGDANRTASPEETTDEAGQENRETDQTAQNTVTQNAATENAVTKAVSDTVRSVQIEAFVSPEVPKNYVETRLNLVTMLREISARSGGRVRVRIHDTRPFSEEAERAEKAYGITPRTIGVQDRGRFDEAEIFMGVVFQSGMEKVTLPFISRGIPVEYELVRSLMTVTERKRKVLGVLETDANLFQKLNPMTGSIANEAAIILELKKTYDVRKIDA